MIPPGPTCASWLAAVLSAAVASAGAPAGRMAGAIEGPTGAPLADVTVALEGPLDQVTLSGADGRFAFEALPDGPYELQAALAGFAPARARVSVSGGEAPLVTLRLQVLVFDSVVVTAEKAGARDPQDLPLAVSVLSGDELERARAASVEDLAGLAPAVTFSQNTGFAQLTIRGIGTNAIFAGSDPSSAVYVDGVYLARPAMALADFLDVERVEVLRGPQGTLYGRNAVGGALHVLTREPGEERELEARVAVGDRNALRGGARVSGLLAGPVSGSLAALRGVRQGFVRDLTHPDRPLGGEDVAAARGKLRVRLGERGELLLSGDVSLEDPVPLTYAKVLAVKPGFEVDNPADLHEVRTSTPASSRNLQKGTAARLVLPLTAGVTLTSLTAWRTLDYEVLSDTDVTELDLTVADVHEIQRQWSQELTVAGRRPGLSWLGGVFLLQDDDRQPTSVRLGGLGVENRLDPRVEASSGALFGQSTVALTGSLAATAGLRYTRERKTLDNAGSLRPLERPELPVPGSAYAYTDEIAHAAWTPKLGLEARLPGHGLVYVSASRGFKSGGFNLTSPEAGRGYAPELAWSYEAGLKTTLADGRARLALAAFHTDYTDLQVQLAIRPGVIDISNAADATIRGVELEGGLVAAGPFALGAHFAWLDARYDRYVAVGVGGITGDVAGRRLSNAPEWSGRLWLEWKARAGGETTVALRAGGRFQSTVYFTPFNDAVQRQSPYGLVDMGAEVARGRFAVAVYARNLTGEDYITGSFSSPPPAIGGRPGAPRELGLELALRR